MGKYEVHTVARHLGAIRSLSKWAVQNEYIDRPFRFGTEFNLPSQKALRAAKTKAGDRTYTPAQVKKVLASKSKVLRAMFLLSLNGGVGNTDISDLKDSNVKADRIEFARSKTGVARVIPLWPETVAAIEAARAVRPAAKNPEWDDRVFLTERGYPYVRDNLDTEGGLTSTTDKIASLFWKEMKALGVSRTFYDGRRTFQTIGDEIGPPHVVRFIMGHATRGDDMSGRYRQSIPHSQLLAVVTHVKTRLHVGGSSVSASAKSSGKSGSAAKARRGGKSGKPQRRKP
jgi:integrase